MTKSFKSIKRRRRETKIVTFQVRRIRSEKAANCSSRESASEKMHLKNNNESMLSLTKSIDIASSAASTLSIKTSTIGERFVVQKANSLEDGFSSEAISSCSDSNDDKSSKNPPRKLNESIDEVSFDDSSESDRDSIMDNFDVTLVDDADCFAPKNEAERMFFEVVEFLRIEQEVKICATFIQQTETAGILNLKIFSSLFLRADART